MIQICKHGVQSKDIYMPFRNITAVSRFDSSDGTFWIMVFCATTRVVIEADFANIADRDIFLQHIIEALEG
jgi:hypothetical protein